MSLPLDFDWKFYCTYYKDLTFNGINNETSAKQHYLKHGKSENRIYNQNQIQLQDNLRKTWSFKQLPFCHIGKKYIPSSGLPSGSSAEPLSGIIIINNVPYHM